MRTRITLLSLALAGCASGGAMTGIMSSWRGASLDQAVAQWGYPIEERNVAGKRLVVWGGAAQSVGTVWQCTRILEVDGANTVVGWQWEGNNCPFMEAGEYANWRRKN